MLMQRVHMSLCLSRWIMVLSIFLISMTLVQVAKAQDQPQKDLMAQRINQITRVILEGESCEAIDTALELVPRTLYGGLRMLPSKGDFIDQTKAADEATRRNEARIAEVLNAYVQRGVCPELSGKALEIKLHVEEISEVAQAVGRITAECGEGDNLREPPCDDLQPLLNEKTGEEFRLGQGAAQEIIRAPFFVKLRGPAVPYWIRKFEEDIRVTEPIPLLHCSVVFKEFKGLMLRLRLDRIIVVTDPWVSVFGVPRGTKIPVWRLDWVPSQYVKTWNMCNVRGRIVTTHNQQVKQDVPLNFFWHFYPKGGH